MFCTTVTNTPTQWTPAGSFGLPAVHPYYLPFNLHNDTDMGRKKKAAPSQATNSQQPIHPHRPPFGGNQGDTYGHVEQPQSNASAAQIAPPAFRPSYPGQWGPPSAPGATTSLPIRPVSHHQQAPWNRTRVSQPTPQSLVDAWRSYRADHIRPQEPATGPAYNTPYWATTMYQNQTWTAPQAQFRPQAPAFQPGQRLVNGFLPHSSYRIDKTSRYNLRSGQRRPLTTATADQIVQSIETDSVQQQNSTAASRSRGPTRRREPTPINTDVEPVPAPKPSTAYLKHAEEPTKRLTGPRKLLILLDLNGTLVYRHGANRQFSVKRPGVDRLLNYLFENHAVMIFTSATQRSAEKMARELLTPKQYGELVTIRCREHLGLKPEQFRNKVQVYKDLNKIWTVPEVRQSALELRTKWDMTNTVLIDDSIVKAESHPHNLLQVTEFMHPASNEKKAREQWKEAETRVMLGVETKLEALKYQASVASQICEWQKAEASSPGTLSFGANDNVDEATKLGAIREETVDTKADSEIITGYPTPTSLARGTSSAEEDDDDEYDPEQWQGVKLPTPSDDESPAARKASGDRAMDSKEETRAVRSPSPVTAADFSWLAENKDVAK